MWHQPERVPNAAARCGRLQSTVLGELGDHRSRRFAQKMQAQMDVHTASEPPLAKRCMRTWTGCTGAGAAKVVRIREPAALLRANDSRLKTFHLTRGPEKVISSRLSLRVFTRRGYFKPEGGPEGVVRPFALALTAKPRVKRDRGVPGPSRAAACPC